MNASLSRLRSFYGALPTRLLLHALITREFSGTIAVLVTEGGEALLTQVAEVSRLLPVLVGGTADKTLPAKLGFSTIIPVADDSTIEDMALLALLCDERPAHNERIMIDADGVFRIYPLTPTGLQVADTQDNADWSV